MQSVPEFRSQYYPIIIDFVADPPFELVRHLDKERLVQVSKLKIDTARKLAQLEHEFLTKVAEIKAGYLDQMSELVQI